MRPSFGPADANDFYPTVKQRVAEYFRETGKTKHANFAMWVKTLSIFALYFFCYGAIMSNYYSGLALIGWYSGLGLSMSLFGFNFSHDVMHNAFFASPRLNNLWSYFFDLNGSSSYIWKLSHNVYHHTYTNIPGHDHDIDKAILLRLSPKDKLYPFHAYQHIYAPFLYLFTSLNWMFYSDFRWFQKAYQERRVAPKDLILFLLFKALYTTLFLILPLLTLSAPTWQILLGFLSLHFIGGFLSAIVFQLAHIVEEVQFPTTDTHGKIPDPWAVHELKTTSNFATQSKICHQLVGGLNYQVEHHLFTGVCHIHYPALSRILKQTAHEFNLPYIEQPTFTKAVLSHLRTLKRFGRTEAAFDKYSS